ncbi:MAG: hypothetical protein JO303_02990 [Caulobacteraceae bacterium]|nr:hypothetical protein [Caulobacteraceae bacterium]
MGTYVYLCTAAEAPPHRSVTGDFGTRRFTLFNTGERYLAVPNPRGGAAPLGVGHEGDAALCPQCGRRIALHADSTAAGDCLSRLHVAEHDGKLYAVL